MYVAGGIVSQVIYNPIYHDQAMLLHLPSSGVQSNSFIIAITLLVRR
jgi:hypothetical protein